MVLTEVPQRAFAGDGFNAPDSGRDAAFFQNFDQADFSGRGRVRPAAEFGGEVADLDDANPVAIFLSEQGHGFVFVDGDIDGHVLDDFDLLVAEDFFVDQVFDVLQFFVGNAGEVREVKAQMVGRDQRPRLLHVLAQNFAQPGLQQVRGRVVAHGGFADFGVDDGIDFIADANRLLGDDLVRAHALNRGVAAFHFGDDGVVIVAVEPSAVADLSAGFGVERGMVEDDFAFVARLELLRALAVVDDGEDFAVVGASLAVAFELGLRELLVCGIGGLLGCAFPGCACAFALFVHGVVEARLIEHQASIANCILNEVKGQPICVVKLERVRSRNTSRAD